MFWGQMEPRDTWGFKSKDQVWSGATQCQIGKGQARKPLDIIRPKDMVICENSQKVSLVIYKVGRRGSGTHKSQNATRNYQTYAMQGNSS